MVRKSTDWQHNFKSVLTQVEAQNEEESLRTITNLSITNDAMNAYFNTRPIFNPISRINYTILRILILNEGSMNQTEISNITYRAKHTITNAVDTLERQGLVKRESVKGDRRVNNVTITMKGLDLIKNSMDEWAELYTMTVSCLDETEQMQLVRVLQKLQNHLTDLKESA